MTGPRRGHFVDAGEGERLTYEVGAWPEDGYGGRRGGRS